MIQRTNLDHSLTTLLRTIWAVSELPLGWDYGSGGPASRRAVASATLLAYYLNSAGASDLDASPGQDGSILIGAKIGNKDIEVQCFSDDRFDMLIEFEDTEEAFLEDLSFGDISDKIGELGWRSKRSFVSCTRSVISRQSDDTIERPFRTLPAAEYRSSVVTASKKVACQSAHTFGSSTARTFVASHQSSGEFRQIDSRLVAA